MIKKEDPGSSPRGLSRTLTRQATRVAAIPDGMPPGYSYEEQLASQPRAEYCGCRIVAGELVCCEQEDCGEIPSHPDVDAYFEGLWHESVQQAQEAALPPPAPPESLAALLAEPESAAPYRVEGLLPSGARVILSAQSKAGKTTLVGNLIRCLADGAPFLGQHATAPIEGRIAVLDTEMTRNQFRQWLKDQGIARTAQVVFELLRGRLGEFDILSPEGRQNWSDYFRARSVDVLIIDCLRPILDAFGINENTGVGSVLVALDELTQLAGISELVLVQHMGHHGERSRGSSRLRDWPDVEWQLVREDAEDSASRRYFKAYGRDVEVPESALDYDKDTRHLTLAGAGSRKTAKADAEVTRVVELVRSQPDLCGRDIEQALTAQGVPEKVARAALKRALEVGQVTRKQVGTAYRHRVSEGVSKIAESGD